ncbi:MAG: leucine-rich repeat domain-containing protein [Maribacter sp.]
MEENPVQEVLPLEFNGSVTPTDLTKGVNLLPIPALQWTVKNALEGESITFSIRLGTSETELTTIATNQTELHLQLDFLLDPETTYFWQVALNNRDGGETLSPVYQFTSGPIEFKDPVIEQIVRDALSKPAGNITREEMESLVDLPFDSSIPFYEAMEPYGLPETLSGLEYGKNLSFVNFYGKGFRVPLTDITALRNLENITYLNLANNQITELQSLAGLKELTYLHVGWNIGITDITPLTNLKKLKTLDLTYTYGLRDLSPLASLPQLDSLLMTTARYVEDAAVIGELTNLKKLRFTSNDNISDFSFLENLTEMRDLSLYSNDSIADISFLSAMPKLVKLNISKNKVTDIAVLENLINLEYLELNDLDIQDFSVLTNLTNLKEVWFHDDDIDESIISVQELREALPNTVFKINSSFYAKVAD